MSYEGPQFYDNAAVFQTYVQHRRSPDNPNDTLEKPIMLALLGSVRGVHLLDLGCGDAALGTALLEQGAASYLGLDGSRNMVERSQQTRAETVGRVVQADIRSWTYPPNTFDRVLSRLALHYIEDVVHVFQQIFQTLRPAGLFVFSVEHLKIAGFSATPRSRLVRHQHDRYPAEELRRHGWLELYQSYQGRSVFHHVDHSVSFYGVRGTRAAFYGVYKVLRHGPASEGRTLSSCPWSQEWHQEARFFYALEREARFDDLRDRVIVDWGPGTRSWIQKATNKPVLELQEPRRRLPPFEDYLEFSLTYCEPQDLFAHEEAHREWRAHLSAVGGVYLILAEGSGHMYVGSATGEGGIWARWRHYARTGHGGNMLLRALIAQDPAYPNQFRFSVLQILPKTMARDEVVRREALYKRKLGTRATGLNLN